ncbi:MAG: tetratricopeptide repeat protein [Candidatus Omnitrophica bacterium]|nr:tetratricopeptide repeat protein [Candidatus Omnitrophota bacterium]
MNKIGIKTILFFLVFQFIPLYAAFAQDTNFVKSQYEAGVLAFKQNKYLKAITHFEDALRVYPRLAPAHNFLGMAHKAAGAPWSTVARHYEQAVAIDPTFSFAYENLAKGYYGHGDFDKAEEYCLLALEHEPDLVTARIALGWIYLLGKSQTTEAIEAFESVLARQEVSYAYFGLGLAYFLENERGQVLEMITQLKLSGQDTLAIHLEAMLRENKYIPPATEGMPLFYSHSFQKAVMGKEIPKPVGKPAAQSVLPPQDKFKQYENMPVKVRSSNPPLHKGTAAQEVLTGEERIKQLQRNTMMIQSGY